MSRVTRILTLLSFVLATPALAQWPPDPSQNLAIAQRPSEQVLPLIAGMSDGGCYVGWFDLASGNYDVYLQRLDAAGVEQWPHNGILVSGQPQASSLTSWDMMCDSEGNAVLVFSDTRSGDLDVQTYRVSPDGDMLWGPDGISLSVGGGYEPAPAVTQATDGDFVYAWARFPDVGDGAILMQRLSPEGVPRFAAGGIPVVTQAGEDPAFPDIIPSLDGSVIVSWVRDISVYMSPRHLRVQRFAADGSPVWPQTVAYFDAAAVPLGYWPKIQSDMAGGMVGWWHWAAGSMYKAAVQRVTLDGVELFPHNGSQVSIDGTRHHIDPTCSFRASTGEIFVFWNERNSAQSQWGIYGQKFSAAGATEWGSTGLVLMPVNTIYKSYPRSVPLADGAVCFIADEPTGVYGDERLSAIRLDGAGQWVWGGSPVVLSSVLSSKNRLPVIIDGIGVSKIVWEDDRNGNPDVYGQNLNPDGTLGPLSASLESLGIEAAWTLRSSPNPFVSRTEIELAIPASASAARLTIADAAGRQVRSFDVDAPGPRTARIVWDGRDDAGADVPAGVYFLKLETTRDIRRCTKVLRLR